jgi:transcriptional regulator with XRE-family HTH domain
MKITFGKRLDELMRRDRIERPQLAAMIGLSAPMIGKYIDGGAVPGIDIAKKIADIFDVSLDDMVSWDPSEVEEPLVPFSKRKKSFRYENQLIPILQGQIDDLIKFTIKMKDELKLKEDTIKDLLSE